MFSLRLIALMLLAASTDCSYVRRTRSLIGESKISSRNQYEKMVVLEPGVTTSTSLECRSTNITNWLTYSLAFSKCNSTEAASCSPICSGEKIYENLDQSKYSASAISMDSLTLQINDVVPSDEGFYKCQLIYNKLSQQVDFLIYKVIVAQKILSVGFVPTDTIKVEDDRLVVEYGRQSSLVCLVRGGYPLPQVDVFIDGKEVTKEMMAGEPKEVDGIWETRLSDDKFKLSNLDYEKKQISCLARVEGRDIEGKTKDDTKTIQILHEPHIESCVPMDNPLVGRPLGLMCTIKANPAIRHATWEVKHLNVTLRANESTPHGMQATLRQGTHLQEPTKYNVRLDIANLSMSHAGEFWLTVSNSFGNRTHKFDLNPRSSDFKEERAASHSALNSGSAIVPSSLLSVMLLIVKLACCD